MRRDKILAVSALLLLGSAGVVSAQDIYKVVDLSGDDLNGTARFVGMGGALGALGADMSVMGTNPAGIGLYRSSDVAISGGMLRQAGAQSFDSRNPATASLDNIGFVYAMPMGQDALRFFNIGFNYHKKKNFHSLFGGSLSGLDNLGGNLSGISQSWEFRDLTLLDGGILDLTWDDQGNLHPDFDLATPTTGLAALTDFIQPSYDENGNLEDYYQRQASSNTSRVARWGGIEEYDFNFSANVYDQVYLGLTLSAYHVAWHNSVFYGESLYDNVGTYGDYSLQTRESLTGNGFDVKFGIILRPIKESAFRVGLSFTSPTFYNLTHSAYAYMNTPIQSDEGGSYRNDVDISPHDYQIRTPWKFNVSLGHTIGNFLAIGAEYEYANYSTAKIRYGDYYGDYWGYFSGSDDEALNHEVSRFLKPVHTVRVGLEARVADGVYLRAGYNHVTAPMKAEAYNNLFTSSPSYYYNVNTDYLNWKATNRYTAGIGYRGKHFYADVAYQFQRQDGDYYAFYVAQDGSEANALPAIPLKLKRHQALLTLGYKF